MSEERNQLVRVEEAQPTPPPVEIILGATGCPCVHIARSQRWPHLVDVTIKRGDQRLEAFSLTGPEQKRFLEALRRIWPDELS